MLLIKHQLIQPLLKNMFKLHEAKETADQIKCMKLITDRICVFVFSL